MVMERECAFPLRFILTRAENRITNCDRDSRATEQRLQVHYSRYKQSIQKTSPTWRPRIIGDALVASLAQPSNISCGSQLSRLSRGLKIDLTQQETKRQFSISFTLYVAASARNFYFWFRPLLILNITQFQFR